MSQFEPTAVPLSLPSATLRSYPRTYPLDGSWASTITQNAADAASYPPCYTHDSGAQQPIQSAYSNTLQGTTTNTHWAQGHSPQLEYPLSVKHSCGEMAMQQSSPPVSGVSADPAIISTANDLPQRSWANGHTLVARRRSYPDSSQPALGYPYFNSHRRVGTLTDTPHMFAKHYSSQFLLQQGLSNVLVNDHSKTRHSIETPAPMHHAPSPSCIASHHDAPYIHPETEVITVPSQSSESTACGRLDGDRRSCRPTGAIRAVRSTKTSIL